MRESMLRVSGLGLLVAAVTLLAACGGDPEKESCGDGTVSSVEECDDGNTANGDGCSSTCSIETAATETNCADGADDDADGAVDCADSDCASDGACATPAEDCANGSDDDGDGQADCADSDCAAAPDCATPEDCAVAGDEDGDGSADCADSDCATVDGCFEVCDDGVDNNGDGTTDCADPTCSDAVVCESFCGDGVVDAGEGCDNGEANSDIDPDACRNNCQPAFCGDGVFDTGEQCDSGTNNSDTQADSCRTTCKLPTCGDGAVDTGEQCDSGGDNSDTAADACRTSCALPTCGDGAVDTGEGCDAGADNSDTAVDGCRTNCARSTCGDGVLDTGEACDNGAANSDTTPGACRTRCVLAYCGDGTVDAGESCDSGTDNSDTVADACRTTCVAASCGDGVVDSGEACDAADENSDTAPNACRTTCALPTCGDGTVDTGEACDAGALNGDGGTNPCRTACLLPGCGDGIVDAGEACDNGRDNSDLTADACRTSCTLAVCGDGIVDSGEACDGGASNSDTEANACRTTCAVASCGDGVVDEFESCDNGADNSDSAVNGCRTTCAPAFCGDGVVDSGEACDAGAGNSDTAADGCRTSCAVAACGDGVVDAGEQCDDGAANGSSAVCGEACVINHAIACDDTDLRDPATIDPPSNGRFLVQGNLATGSDDFAGGCGANPGVEEVVVFVAPSSGDYLARTSFLGTIADTSVRVLSDCGDVDSEIACGADGALPGDLRGQVTFTAVAGRAYYLLVEAELGTEAPYLLEVAPVVAATAPVVTSATGRYLTANNVQIAVAGTDAEQDIASVEVYALLTIPGDGSGSGATPPTTERTLLATFARGGLTYSASNGFSTQVELTTAPPSAAASLEVVAVDAAGNASLPFSLANPAYTEPTTVATGATCDPTQQLTVCAAPQACTRQANATYLCGAARAPSLASVTVTRSDLTNALVRLTGFDTNADVTRFRAEFYTASNGRLGQIEGNLSATLLGQANYDVTFNLAGVNAFPTATQIRFVTIDQRGLVSNQLAASLAAFADRTAGQSCDPSGAANRCAAGLSCLPKQDGGTACTAPSAPVITGAAARVTGLGLAAFGPVSGFDADGGLVSLEVVWNFPGGGNFAESYSLAGFTFLQSGTVEFDGAAPETVTFIAVDASGNRTVAPPVTVARPGDPGASCDREGTSCLANDYACGAGQYCEPAAGPSLASFSFDRTNTDTGLAIVSGSDDNADISQVRIDALDATGGPIVGRGWLVDITELSDSAAFDATLDITGLTGLRTGTTISATLIDRTGRESNTITIALPAIAGVSDDCSDPSVAICDDLLACRDGLCIEVIPTLSSFSVTRDGSTNFDLALAGVDPDGDAAGFLYAVTGPGGESVASGATSAPADHEALGGAFDLTVTLSLLDVPNGSTISVRVVDALGHASAPLTEALPILIPVGDTCSGDSSVDSCETDAICYSSLCMSDVPFILNLTIDRLSLDEASIRLDVIDAQSNLTGIDYVALDESGAELGTIDSDLIAPPSNFATLFKSLSGLGEYSEAAAIRVTIYDANGDTDSKQAVIPRAVGLGDTCDPALDLCTQLTVCSSVTGSPVCTSSQPSVESLEIETSADLRTFVLTATGFDGGADVVSVDLSFSLNGIEALPTTYTVAAGEVTQNIDGTVSFSTVLRWNTETLSNFNGVTVRFVDAAGRDAYFDLDYAALAPLALGSACDAAPEFTCGAGTFCDLGLFSCAVDTSAACGAGVDVTPLESGTFYAGDSAYGFDAIATPEGNALDTSRAGGNCGSDGDEAAILFSAGTGTWNVTVSDLSGNGVFVSTVAGACAIDTTDLCSVAVSGEDVTTTIDTSAGAVYLLLESPTVGVAASAAVSAVPLLP